jgi:hypothetical protein
MYRQGRSVHVSQVNPANTLKNKKLVLHTLEHNRTDQIKCIVNQLLEDYARCEESVSWANIVNMMLCPYVQVMFLAQFTIKLLYIKFTASA